MSKKDGRPGAFPRPAAFLPAETAFDTARRVEDIGVALALKHLRSLPHISDVDIIKFDPNAEGAYRRGDIAYRYAGDRGMSQAEVKTELLFTGNLFLELVSNCEGKRCGWVVTQRADWLFYYFCEKFVMYSINFVLLRKWVRSELERRKLRYSVLKQGKYRQHNETYGMVVPVDHILSDLRCDPPIRFDVRGDLERPSCAEEMYIRHIVAECARRPGAVPAQHAEFVERVSFLFGDRGDARPVLGRDDTQRLVSLYRDIVKPPKPYRYDHKNVSGAGFMAAMERRKATRDRRNS